MKSYRVVTGSRYNPKTDSFQEVAFHMTFYATDPEVLKFLMVAADCPNGRVYDAKDVEFCEPEIKFNGEIPRRLAN